ncbi:MAG: Shedu anti-phage system protein SduA domain-containing protein [Actinomycetota bacterium]
MPQPVAAARLRAALRIDLELTREYEPSDGELAYLAALANSLGVPVPSCSTRGEVRAWVQALRAKQRRASLRALKLKSGDIVAVENDPMSAEEVSSIGRDGTVYLRGHRQAWPDTLTVLARPNDQSDHAAAYRQQARNNAAARARRRAPSLEMLRQLQNFACPDTPTAVEIDELERVVDAATDEGPIQAYLGAHPHVLGMLMRGPDRFVVPQVRLGRDYVGDFFLANVDSSGIRWILLELETPKSDTTLAKSRRLDKHARDGLGQIREWREWLQNNLDQAKRPRSEDGLGLFDMRPQADGLLLVGRRHRLGTDARSLRRQQAEESRVTIHTYDWLIESLRGALSYVGPPGANPHLIHDLPSSDGGRTDESRG